MGKTTTSAAPVFEFLDAAHREIQVQLVALRDLALAIVDDRFGPAEQLQAKAVLAHFNGAARDHHLDEEKHIFPALLRSHSPDLVQATEQLVQDHGWLEAMWLQIEPSLDAARHGNTWFDPSEMLQAVEVFQQLYHEHIELEESIAYPQARKLVAPGDALTMGREMAKRRVVAQTAASAGA
ncbi:MAG: hemerythrin domain-containing protein [Hydrogenophaga sp.]|uniref:hemerythrin domain-containing protein n=1 Tax=Hydrogenophaga sp. TaxID=1904254 RepID=UPI001D48ECE3|nr:hemerythrin domain-containing protein [Hydrogenophaga sp.]MBX3609319.1 hemerythrin domain-containing protein [Hydrogenophaga sp.]